MELDGSQKVVENYVVACIDRGLSVLGEGVKVATLWHIENTYNIKTHEVINEPDKFVDALNRMFGNASKALTMLIVKEIRKTFGDIDGDDFTEMMEELKREDPINLAARLVEQYISR